MKIKKSDLAKIIAEELEAIRTAIPAWLGEQDKDEDEEKEKSIPAYNPDSRRKELEKRNPGRRYSLEEEDYDQLPQAGDPEEEARLKAQRDSASIPNEPLERGTRVKDIRTDREGAVVSQMAGPGGGGAVVKFDDGKEEKIRMQFLQRGEPVKEDIGGEVLAMRDDPEALNQFAAKMAQAFGISPEEAMQKIQTAFGEVDKGMERAKYAKGGSAVGPMSEEAGGAPMSLEDFKQLSPDTEMMPAIKQAEQWYLSNKATMAPDELAQYKDQIDQMHSILFMSDQEGDLSPDEVARVHRSMQEGASSVGWQPDELLDFLRGQPSGVDAKMLAYAFGGQWQAQQAALEEMVNQGQLEKQGKMFVTAPGVEAAPNFEDEPIEELAEIFGFGDDDEASMNPPELAQKIADLTSSWGDLGKQVHDGVMSGNLPSDMMDVGQIISQGARDAEALVGFLGKQNMQELFGLGGSDDGMDAILKQLEAAVGSGQLPTKLLPAIKVLPKAAEAAERAKEAMGNMKDMQEEQEIFSRLREKAMNKLKEYEDDDELADYYDEFPELRQKAADAGEAPADVASQIADEFGSEEEEDEEDAMNEQGGDKEAALRQIVADSQAGQVDGVEVDLFSASAIVKVLDGLNPQNKERYLALDPLSMAEMAMKMMKEAKQKEATNAIRESVSRFMKVTLREEGRHK